MFLLNSSAGFNMSDLKTRPTDQDVEEFLDSVEHPTRKADGFILLEIMKEVTFRSLNHSKK